jgi:hypothetical protein
MSDTSGHSATSPDELHTVPLADLEARVAAAGVLISRRQLMRHCEAGTFEAKKLPAFNNQMHWFVAPDSIEKGIADIKTLQEHRARRDASRPVMSGSVDVEIQGHDTPSHDASRPDVSVKESSPEKTATQSVASGHVATQPDIFEHPYVKKLESQVEKWEGKYHEQVRRTEDIQREHQEKLIELQRMTAVGNSKTLADFMLEWKERILGPASESIRAEADAAVH